jgi:hypothetical protein
MRVRATAAVRPAEPRIMAAGAFATALALVVQE